MIDNILQDCIHFLGLAFVVLFGFGLALHVLSRGIQPLDLDGGDGFDNDDALVNQLLPVIIEDEIEAEVADAFGTFPRSLLTLFFALLGNFNPEVIRLRKIASKEGLCFADVPFCWKSVLALYSDLHSVPDGIDDLVAESADCHYGRHL